MTDRLTTKYRGLLFAPEMARAVWENRKTQTRRAVKLRDKTGTYSVFDDDGWPSSMDDAGDWHRDEPPHPPGSIVYVKERWRPFWHPDLWCSIQYAADSSYAKPKITTEDRGFRFADMCEQSGDNAEPWHSSLHMWREFARTWLRITNVRVERIDEISDADARAESFADRDAFFAYAWPLNQKRRGCTYAEWLRSWCWVYTFERVERPEGI